jgi:O-antigen/teichoic acid export membrane protein
VEATGKRIARNATILMASQLTTWVLTLVLTIFLPRYLGAVNSGKLTISNSIWAIVAIVATFGMDTLLTKEIARKPAQAARLLGASIGLRVILFALGAVVVMFYLRAANYPDETIYVIIIGAFASLTWVLIGACQAVLQGLERMTPMAIATIVGKAVNTLVCIAFLLLGYGVYVAAAVAVLAALVNLTIQLAALRQLAKVQIVFDVRALIELLRAGAPYLMSGVFLIAYGQVDVIIISLLVNEKTVGWYGAASQLFGTSFFIPTVFITAVFPALARMYTDAPDALPRLIQKSFDLLLIVAIPIGMGLFVVADPLVLLLFGAEFAPSGTLLALLGLVLIATYLNILIGQFLISTDRQNRWTLVMAVATLATIPLDLIFVPWCQTLFQNGAIGGALSFLVTEIGMLSAGLMLLPAGALNRQNTWLAVRAFCAGSVMALAAWFLRDQFILVPITVGAMVYAILVLVFRVLAPDDLSLFREIASSFLSRARPSNVATGGTE